MILPNAKRAAYLERAAEFRAAGWTHLGYRIVAERAVIRLSIDNRPRPEPA